MYYVYMYATLNAKIDYSLFFKTIYKSKERIVNKVNKGGGDLLVPLRGYPQLRVPTTVSRV